MPTPYEPVLRHESGPGNSSRCAPCTYGLPNRPCGDTLCACTCNTAGYEGEHLRYGHGVTAVPKIEPREWTEPTDPPQRKPERDEWVEPPAKPEDIKTWAPPHTPERLQVRPGSLATNLRPSPGEAGVDPHRPGRYAFKKTGIKAFIAKWEVPWAITTVLLYLAALVLVIVVFPDVSNLWVSIFVLVSGFTSGLTALASVLKTKE